MISRLGMEDRVLSLTTIGTPHRGSIRRLGLRRLSRSVKPLLDFLGVPTDAFDDLTTEPAPGSTRRRRTCRVSGTTRSPGAARASGSPLWWPALTGGEPEGAHDGVVSVQSATSRRRLRSVGRRPHEPSQPPEPAGPAWGHRPSDYVRLIRRVEP